MSQTLKFGNGTWATKKGSTLAYNDEDGNFKPLPFTYTGAGKGTRVNKEGLIEVVENDRPRIDYLDSEDGVFLLEKASTNLVTYSEDFTQSYFNKVRSSISQNAIISPNGKLDASKLVEDTSTSTTHYLLSPINATAGTWTASIFVKKAEREFFQIYNYNTTLGVFNRTYFNLENGTVVSGDGKIENFGNGWYRCSLTSTLSQTSRFDFILSNNGFSDNYTGDGTSGIYIWGAQLESGNIASSYIPTQGSTQTRLAETASGSGSSGAFNDSEGILFANIAANADDGTSRRISLSNGGASQRISLELDEVSNNVRMLVVSNTFQVDIGANLPDATNYNKIVLKYKENDFSIWTNGYEVATTNSGLTPSSLSTLGFDASVSSSFFYGKTKEIGYYDTALTDLELETLTSYRTWEAMVKELNLNIIHNE